MQRTTIFAIYQTGQHGPQNGYRLCMVHQGYSIASKEKEEGSPEDEIDRLQNPIPQVHEEFVILGTPFKPNQNEEEQEE
ncbi:uncharacterized protein PG998_005098 [Apiospora kogelbergensis]|uniref:uncharacterized protein n=1 Tax=Apiospora kogelbergensis TaxID=1337665 RepID=UPI00313225DB